MLSPFPYTSILVLDRSDEKGGESSKTSIISPHRHTHTHAHALVVCNKRSEATQVGETGGKGE